jgi:cytochrome c556
MVPAAAIAAIDLSDFDDDVMRAMDDAYEDLEPFLSASNVDASKTSVAVLNEGFQWTFDYFTAKQEEGREALELLAPGMKLLAEVQAALDARDFTTAVTRARAIHDNCKACHDKYKPRKQR